MLHRACRRISASSALIRLQLVFYLGASTFLFLLIMLVVTAVYTSRHLRVIMNTRHAEYAALAATELEHEEVGIINELLTLSYSHEVVSAVWSFNDVGEFNDYKRQMASDIEKWLDSTELQAIVIYGAKDLYHPTAMLNYSKPNSNFTGSQWMEYVWPFLPLTEALNSTVNSIESKGSSISWPAQFGNDSARIPRIHTVTVPIKAHPVTGPQSSNNIIIGYLSVVFDALDAIPSAAEVLLRENVSFIYLIIDDKKKGWRFLLPPAAVPEYQDNVEGSHFQALERARKLFSEYLAPTDSTNSTEDESQSALANKPSQYEGDTKVPGVGKSNVGYSFADILGIPVYVFLVVRLQNDHYLESNLRSKLIGVAAGIFGGLLLLILPISWIITKPFYRIRNGMELLNFSRDAPKSTSQAGNTKVVFVPAPIKKLSRPWRDESDDLIDAYNGMVYKLNKYYFSLEDEVNQNTAVAQDARIRAELANVAKSRFIANITHELRSPLNGIMGMTSISTDEQDVDRMKASLPIIIDSGNTLMSLLNDLLAFTEGNVDIEPRVTEYTPKQFLDSINVVDRASKSAKLVRECMPKSISGILIQGDFERGQDVCARIMSNAVKFCDNGKISVYFYLRSTVNDENILFDQYKLDSGMKQMAQATGEVVLTDTGAGITCDQLANVFEPLVQGDESLSKRHKGAGLGMSMAKKIAQAIGGHILVYSEVGIGTTVVVKFPLFCGINDRNSILGSIEEIPIVFPTEEMWFTDSADPKRVLRAENLNVNSRTSSLTDIAVGPVDDISDATITQVSIDTNEYLAGNTQSSSEADVKCSTRILVADDNVLNQRILSAMLQQLEMGVVVDLANSGPNVLERVKTSKERGFQYNIIFMDLRMPGMDGIETARMLRERFNFGSPIVAVTGLSDRETLDRCREDFQEVLVKPVLKEMLKVIFNKYLSHEP